MIVAFLPLFAIAPLLAAVAYFDLRYMRIPNAISAMALVVFALWAAAFPPADLILRLVCAGVVFAAGFLAFSFRLFGGGDVKILAVLMLFVPVGSLTVFSYVFSAAMIAGILLIVGLRQLAVVRRSSWKALGGSTRFPMGISIALAGLCHPFVTMAFAGG